MRVDSSIYVHESFYRSSWIPWERPVKISRRPKAGLDGFKVLGVREDQYSKLGAPTVLVGSDASIRVLSNDWPGTRTHNTFAKPSALTQNR